VTKLSKQKEKSFNACLYVFCKNLRHNFMIYRVAKVANIFERR